MHMYMRDKIRFRVDYALTVMRVVRRHLLALRHPYYQVCGRICSHVENVLMYCIGRRSLALQHPYVNKIVCAYTGVYVTMTVHCNN